MSAYPAASEQTKLNVWFEPDPEAGVTDTFVGGRLPPKGTVQEPNPCHPEKTPALLIAPMETVLVPLKFPVKVSARLTVKLFPDPELEEAPASSEHWPFDRTPAVPSVAEPTYPLPLSATSWITFVARVYCK